MPLPSECHFQQQRQQHICRGALRTLMVTGDYHYTATSVARQVGMIPPEGQVMLIQADSEFRSLSLSLDPNVRADERESWPDSPASPMMPFKSSTRSQRLPSLHCQSAPTTPHGLSVGMSDSGSQLQLGSGQAAQLKKAKSALRLDTSEQSGGMMVSFSLPPRRQQLQSMAQQQDSFQPDSSEMDGQLPWHLQAAPASSTQHQGHPQSVAEQPHTAAGHPRSSAGHPLSSPGHPQHTCQGLRVTLEGRQEAFSGQSALQALTAVAQGQAQCCITGPAFAHLLQHADVSLLESVMQNVVVFARMQSHQKGQVMDLLGGRGLHQVLSGEQRHIQVSSKHGACISDKRPKRTKARENSTIKTIRRAQTQGQREVCFSWYRLLPSCLKMSADANPAAQVHARVQL